MKYIANIKITLVLSCALLLASLGRAQELELEIECFDGIPGENVCIDILAFNFDQILSVQFGLQYDPQIIQISDIVQINLDNADANSFTIDNTAGVGTLVWFYTPTSSIPDGGILLSLCFDIVGNPGEISPLTFVPPAASDNTPIEFGSNNGAVPFVLNSCDVEVICPNVLTTNVNSCPASVGEEDGSAVVSLCCGEGPYTFEYALITNPVVNGNLSLSDDCGELTLTDLPAGTYDTRITDGNGVQTVGQFEILEGEPITADIVTALPNCPGQATADIFIPEISGGAPPYIIELWRQDSLISRGSDTIDNIAPDSYILRIYDSLGCVRRYDIVLPDRELSMVASVADATCPGIEDGSIVVTLQGGMPINGTDFIYDWENGPTNVAANGFLLNIPSGEYTVTAEDANGCQFTDTFTVGATKRIGIDVVMDSINCSGDNDGGLLVSAFAVDGTDAPPYTFDWGTNAPASTDTDNTSEITNLSGQDYDLIITDQDGCILDTTLTTFEPDALNVIWSNQQATVSCDENDGQLIVLAFGGSPIPGMMPPYLFDWGPGLPMNNVISNLPGDSTYSVTVTDDNGCMDSLNIYLPITPTIEITGAVITDPTCSTSEDGMIEVSIDPAQENQVLEVTWFQGDTGLVADGLGPGSYTIRILNQDSCVTTETYVLQEIDGLEIIDVVIETPTCSGQDDGQITVFVSGALGDLNFAWDHPNGTNNPVLPNIGAGTYTVTISDQSGCPPLVQEIEVLDEDGIEIEVLDIQGIPCFNGPCDGSIEISVSGGPDPSAGYTITWEDNSNGTTAQNLCPGYFSVTVTNTIDCGIIDSFLIPSGDQIVIGDADITGPLCAGDQNGSVTISGAGGEGNYSYQWQDPSVMGPTLTGLGAGTYRVEITDGLGCSGLDSILIMDPTPLTLAVDSSNTNSLGCANVLDGMITLNTSGGTPTYQYQWSPNVSTSEVASMLDQGTYSITVTDQNGCTSQTSYTVLGSTPIVANIAPIIEPDCFGGLASFTVLSASGGAGGPYTYTINNGPRIDLGDTTQLLAGEYLVSVFDETGCAFSQNVTISQPSEIILDLPDTIFVDLGQSTEIEAMVIHTLGIDTLIWEHDGDSIECLDSECTTITLTPVSDQQVVVTAIDENGCSVQASTLIILDDSRDVYIPNVFSPNGDGINDSHRLFTQDDVERINYYRIFNRYGQLVHEAQNIQSADSFEYQWNGDFKGQNAEPGVYIFVASVRFVDGKDILYRGDVTLLR